MNIFTFSAKSNLMIGLVALLSLAAFLLVENTKVDKKQEWYTEKLAAARLSKKAADYIREYRLEKGVFIDVVNDPNQTALIGQEYTLITTDRGYIDSKLSSTNPNMAAVIVQLLKDAGLNTGDSVAIALTGSFPALNISVLAAIETLKLHPLTITSAGSSSWGANDPYFTWLDMERLLVDARIFHQVSVAASIGGGSDIGRGLSPEGRSLLEKAIERNHIPLIKEEHLEKSIARRMKIYSPDTKTPAVKAFINVGGGIASLGNPINGKLFPAGLTTSIPAGNFATDGVLIQMGQAGIPVIHLLNIDQLLTKYSLPVSPVPLPEPGSGEIFVKKKYNVLLTGLATAILIASILILYIQEQKRHKPGSERVENNPHQPSNRDETDDSQDPGL